MKILDCLDRVVLQEDIRKKISIGEIQIQIQNANRSNRFGKNFLSDYENNVLGKTRLRF